MRLYVRETSENMQRFGLLGYPIAHSLSPSLFKAGYDGRYDYELVEQEDFDTAWRIFLKRYQAVNVTAPFKEQAFEKAKIRSRECELIGAANILVQTPKGVSAWNSDCTGVAALLRKVFGGDHFLDGRSCRRGGWGRQGGCCGCSHLRNEGLYDKPQSVKGFGLFPSSRSLFKESDCPSCRTVLQGFRGG